MLFYGISSTHPYKQYTDQIAYMDTRKKYRKTASTSLPDDGTLGCSKHVEDSIIKLKHYRKRCAFCVGYITMHGSINVQR
jgi:hypothetical protein